jgi:hypothetical protein
MLATFFGVAQISISGVINASTAVVSIGQPNCLDCDPTCRDSVKVENANAFQKGDRALIIQMKGASINTANSSAAGQITSIANAENYEFFLLDSVDQAGDFIFPRYGLIKGYVAAGQVQVERIISTGPKLRPN